MNKKSQATIIFILFIIVIVIAIGLYVAFKDKINPPDNLAELNETKILLKNYDSKDKSQLESGICIYKNNLLSQCIKTDSLAWTELNLELYKNYSFYINTSGYYSMVYEIENLYPGYPKSEIPLNKFGEINIFQSDSLNEGVNKVLMDVEFKNKFQKLMICSAWSKGIIYAIPEQLPLTCNTFWTNCTAYDQVYKDNQKINRCINSLPENQYYCSANLKYENCEKVDGDKCYAKQIDPPSRLNKVVSHCTYYGNDLNDEKFLFSVDIKTFQLDSNDYVDLYFIDQDLISKGNYGSEIDGKDIGKNDYVYRISKK